MKTTAFALLALALARLATAAPLEATPWTTEGPYYPFNSQQRLPALADRDADLTRIGDAKKPAAGRLFLLSGRVLDRAGAPVPDATVELWQADDHGTYYHSADRMLSRRDAAFQGFGATVTDAQGRWAFRTVLPGLYVGRIRHFHYKVKLAGREVLTSQIVFADQRAEFASDNVTAPLGRSVEALVVTPATGVDAEGATALLASRDIVIDPSASARPTPAGPPPGGGRPGSRPPPGSPPPR